MEIRVIQNSVGRFNVFGNEKTLSFSMGIYEDSKVMEVDGIKAILHYSGEEDEADDFKDSLDNLPWIVERCLAYSDSVFSTVNYEKQCLLFSKIFNDNYETLCENRIEKQKEEINKEIIRLSERLSRLYGFDDISGDVNYFINNKIQRYKKWIASSTICDMKEGTDLYEKEKTRLDGYEAKIKELEESLLLIER